MPRRLQIAEHLSVPELRDRYRQATDGIERSHYQMIWLLAQGRTSKEVCELTDYSRDRLYKLVRQYNQHGPAVLGDQRHHNRGKPPMLNDVEQAQLLQALQEAPLDGDLWDGPKVAQWMSELLGRPVYPQRGWEYLKALEMRRCRPRPCHTQSDPDEQAAWQKNSPKKSKR